MYCLLPKQSTRQKFPSVFCFKKQRNIRKRKELCMKSMISPHHGWRHRRVARSFLEKHRIGSTEYIYMHTHILYIYIYIYIHIYIYIYV